MEFVDRIDLKLKEKGIKRFSFCEDMNITHSALTDWSKRGTIPSADTVLKIANYLNVSMEWLLTGRNPEGITDEEAELLRRYRTLDARDKSVVTVLLNALASKEKTD